MRKRNITVSALAMRSTNIKNVVLNHRLASVTLTRVVKPKIEMLINHPIIVLYDSTYKMGNFGTKIIKIG